MSQFAAVIPAFNEEKTIRDLAERALKQVDLVVVVNDGSTDGTAQQLAGLPIEYFSNPTNQGKAHALWLGFRYALELNLEGVITFDGDGQHQPEDISKLIAAYQDFPNHLIIGTRTHDIKAFPLIRRWANQSANWGISLATGRKTPDTQSGFRIYPASLLRILEPRSRRFVGFVFESEVIIEAVKLGFHIRSIPIAAIYGSGFRRSHFHPIRDTLMIGKMILGKVAAKTFTFRQ